MEVAIETPGATPVEEAHQIDEAMLAMGAFVAQMTEIDGYLVDDLMETAMRVEKIHMSIPIQLQLEVRDDGSVMLGSSPPLYYTETTVLPVFHQLNVNITVTENDDARNSQ